MTYFVLSLPEATGLYLGLGLQQDIRQHLYWLPLLLMLIGALRVLWVENHRDGDAMHVGSAVGLYLGTSLLLCVLFWPEATRFGRLSPLAPTQIASYAASEDPAATLVTAADAGQRTAPPVFETPGFRLLLGAWTDLPLALARRLNQQTHRPFSPIVSTSWLLGLDLTTDVTRALADWVEACWKPSMTQDQEFQDAITARDLLPWGDTPVARALATREAVPGAMTGGGYFRSPSPLGLLFLSNPGTTTAVRCDVYLRAVELDVQRWLFTTTSPAGTPLSEVLGTDLPLTVEEQAQFLIYREAMRALGRPSPAPSLGAAYASLSAAHAATGGLSQAGKGRGGLMGALLGGGQAALNQFDGILQSLLWAVGLAMWFIYWSPFLFGFAFQVLVGLFPVIACYALLPGRPFQPLVLYFTALLYVCCSPLWFALVDLSARAATTLAPQSQDALLSTLNWAPAQSYAVVVTVIGLVIVQPLGAALLFVSGRGLVNWIRH